MSNWKYAYYRQQGLSHATNAIDCQDYVLIKETEELLVAALSDGLGSLKNSQIASRLTVEKSCDFFLNTLSPSFWDNKKKETEFKKEFVLSVVDFLKKEAENQNIDINTLDCTLCFVCVSKKKNQAIVGYLGDSAVCVVKKEETIVFSDSSISANGTYAILDDNAVDHLHLSRIDLTNDVLGFIITSDGLENEIFTKGSPYINKAAEQYFNLLNLKDSDVLLEKKIKQLVDDKGYMFDDDISLAVLSRADDYIVFDNDVNWLCKCGYRNKLYETYCSNCSLDFLTLYGDVNFKEHGGRFAFFKKINKNPEKEKQLIVLDPLRAKNKDTCNSMTQECTANNTNKDNVDMLSTKTMNSSNKTKKLKLENRSKSFWFILLSLFCVLLVTISGAKFRKKTESHKMKLTEKVQTYSNNDNNSICSVHIYNSETYLEPNTTVVEKKDKETVFETTLTNIVKDKTESAMLKSETTKANDNNTQAVTETTTAKASETATVVQIDNILSVVTEDVSLKKEPSNDSEVIGILSKGETVKVFYSNKVSEDSYSWVEIETNAGQRGWIKESTVQKTQ